MKSSIHMTETTWQYKLPNATVSTSLLSQCEKSGWFLPAWRKLDEFCHFIQTKLFQSNFLPWTKAWLRLSQQRKILKSSTLICFDFAISRSVSDCFSWIQNYWCQVCNINITPNITEYSIINKIPQRKPLVKKQVQVSKWQESLSCTKFTKPNHLKARKQILKDIITLKQPA